MVEMAKGLVWPMAFINVRPVRCGQLGGIGNGTLVVQLLEEYWVIIPLCLPMHQAYIIEYQRLFILKGTSCIMTIKRSRKENVRRLHSVAFAYGLVPPFSVFL